MKDPGLFREQLALETLSNLGFDVEKLSEAPNGNRLGRIKASNPDFLLNGKVYECYAPESESSALTIHRRISQKVRRHSRRFVLYLSPSHITNEELTEYLVQHPIRHLREILIIRNESVTQWQPQVSA